MYVAAEDYRFLQHAVKGQVAHNDKGVLVIQCLTFDSSQIDRLKVRADRARFFVEVEDSVPFFMLSNGNGCLCTKYQICYDNGNFKRKPIIEGVFEEGKFIIDFEAMLKMQIFASEYQKAKDTWFK